MTRATNTKRGIINAGMTSTTLSPDGYGGPQQEDIMVKHNGQSYETFGMRNGKLDNKQPLSGMVSDSDSSYTLQEAIDACGFGAFQIRMSFVLGINYIADSIEIMLLSVLSPILKCEFHLTAAEESILAMVVFIGMLLSGNFWGNVGDVYGRRKSLFLSMAISGYFGVLTAFSPTYFWVVFNRSIVALGLGGFAQVFTLYSELIPTKSRSYCLVLIGLIWALGACLAIVLAMATLPTLGWRWYLIFCAVPVIASFFLLNAVPESPRYLLTNGRYNEAQAIVWKIARINGKTLPDGCLSHNSEELKMKEKGKVKDLFCPRYLRTTLLLGIIMASCNMAYYGTALLTTSLFDKNDGCHGYTSHSHSKPFINCRSLCTSLTFQDYVDLFYTTLGDAPGLFICIGLMSWLGRRPSLAIQLFLYTALMAICNICAPRSSLVGLIFAARAMAMGMSQGIFVYITEVYPTSIRALGMGWCITTKSLGVIVASLLANVLLEYSSFLGISSFAVVGFVGAVATCLLPYETKNRDLVDTVEDERS